MAMRRYRLIATPIAARARAWLVGDRQGRRRRRSIAVVLVLILATLGFGVVEMLRSSRADENRVVGDLVTNIEQRVAAGDWSLGDGIVRTLEAMAGQRSRDEILGGRTLVGWTGTGVILTARDYVAANPQDATSQRIRALVDLLQPTQAELDAVSVPRPGSAATRIAFAAPLPLGEVAVAQRGPLAIVPIGCAESFEAPPAPAPAPSPTLRPLGSSVCFLWEELTVGGDRYRIYVPRRLAADPAAGHYAALVVDAVKRAVPLYERYGTMPPANFVFVSTEPENNVDLMETYETPAEEPCAVVIRPAAVDVAIAAEPIQGRAMNGDDIFRQVVAHELFHCYQFWNISGSTGSYKTQKWWVEGTAESFSDLAYPDVGFEHEWLDAWQGQGWASPDVLTRNYDDYLFFQYMARDAGAEAVIALIRALPERGSSDEQRTAFTSVPGAAETFHHFGERLFDGDIRDTNGESIELGAIDAEPVATITQTGPSVGFGDPYPLQHERAVVRLPEGYVYQLATEESGFGMTTGLDLFAGQWTSFPMSVNACRAETELRILVTAFDANYTAQLDVVGIDKTPCQPIVEPSASAKGSGDGANGGVEACGNCATSWGDPHIETFDGAWYSLQLAGEFVLTRSLDDAFEVQVRQVALAGRPVAVNQAVAVRVGSDRIGFYPDGVRLNGKIVDSGAVVLAGGARLDVEATEIVLPDGTRVSGTGDPSIEMAESRRGRLVGLFGDFDGNPLDDLTARDGTVLPHDAEPPDLYEQFGESWRVRPEESLFDYGPGEDTSTYTDPDFPTEYLTLDDLEAQERQRARTICEEAGVTVPQQLERCILDVVVTDDPDYALRAASIVPNARSVWLAPGRELFGTEQELESPTLAVDRDGLPMFAAFYPPAEESGLETRLSFIRCLNKDCRETHTETIAEGGFLGSLARVADDGTPVIAYVDTERSTSLEDQLVVVRCRVDTCAERDAHAFPLGEFRSGVHASIDAQPLHLLVSPTGEPVIVYGVSTFGGPQQLRLQELRALRCKDRACTSAESQVVAATTRESESIWNADATASPSGAILIAYEWHDDSADDSASIRLARCLAGRCETSLIATAHESLPRPAVAVTQDDRPLVVFGDILGTPDEPRYGLQAARCGDAACSLVDVVELTAEQSAVGFEFDSPVAVVNPSGWPVIVARAHSDGGWFVGVVHCADASCDEWTTSIVAPPRPDRARLWLDTREVSMTPSGGVVAAYFDECRDDEISPACGERLLYFGGAPLSRP